MIKVGDEVTVRSVTLPSPQHEGILIRRTGKVVYVHPRYRYCVIEFGVGLRGGRIRESFFLKNGEIFTTGLELKSIQECLARREAKKLKEEQAQARKDYLREY